MFCQNVLFKLFRTLSLCHFLMCDIFKEMNIGAFMWLRIRTVLYIYLLSKCPSDISLLYTRFCQCGTSLSWARLRTDDRQRVF